MATYIFDNTTDGSTFTSTDQLYFVTQHVKDVTVSDIAAGAFTQEAISLTAGGHTVLFHADALSYASNHGGVIFLSTQDQLGLGDSTNNTVSITGTAGHDAMAYGFDGNDSVYGGATNDHLFGGAGNDYIQGSSWTTNSHGDYTEADYLNGGDGNDVIYGGAGNDHIYGNDQSSTAGASDGNDYIDAGNGNDYVNGNAGNDSIYGGVGNDKLYGGAGNDLIDGGNDNDYIQGNKGEDNLTGGAGNDTLHGGADNDVLFATSGNDQLFGDNGDDNLHAGTGFDTLTGGAGNDVFTFGAGSAPITNLLTASTAAHHDQTAVIWDFTHGGDVFSLGFHPAAAANVGTAATNFASIDDAYAYAQTQLAGHGGNVEVLQVGTDSVLFYDSAHTTGTIDSVVVLHGITASTIDFHDFV